MLKYLVLVSLSVLLFTGCAMAPTPVPATIVGNVTYPGFVTTEQGGNKVGRATCKSILGIISSGDCSIEAAKKNGGITTVSTVDYEATNVLVFFASYSVIVTGK